MRIKLFGATFPANQLCIVCHHVLAGCEIVEVGHDEDGVVQVFCEARDHLPSDAAPIGIDHMVDRLRALKLPSLPAGHYAAREGRSWTIRRIPA